MKPQADKLDGQKHTEKPELFYNDIFFKLQQPECFPINCRCVVLPYIEPDTEFVIKPETILDKILVKIKEILNYLNINKE